MNFNANSTEDSAMASADGMSWLVLERAHHQ